MLATVSPENITATARARRSGATRSAAATAPAPKKAPCGSPVISRAAASVQKSGASAHSRLPTVNSPASATSTALRGRPAASAVSSGAPITTPSAYAEISQPACGMEMCRLSATWGRSPMAANSVVPMANAVTASASSARGKGVTPG